VGIAVTVTKCKINKCEQKCRRNYGKGNKYEKTKEDVKASTCEPITNPYSI
jgi:hypothetical protein